MCIYIYIYTATLAEASQKRTRGVNANGVTAKVLVVDRKCICVISQNCMFSTCLNP